MPVLTKKEHNKLTLEANIRTTDLQALLASRPIKSNSEGLVGRKRWTNPDDMVASVGSKEDILLAFSDIQALKSLLKSTG